MNDVATNGGVRAESHWLPMDDGVDIYVRTREGDSVKRGGPRAVLQLVHGIAEHIHRYDTNKHDVHRAIYEWLQAGLEELAESAEAGAVRAVGGNEHRRLVTEGKEVECYGDTSCCAGSCS